jgi:5-methylcytosine-specific restriction endonuclease McrA
LLALGLCATCYTLKRQDDAYFGGLRETVLKRDEYRCRVCGRRGGEKWSLAVHHRLRGRSELDLMITLCLRHHAMVTRTIVLVDEWPELLRALWREQHPGAHEQTAIDFSLQEPPAKQTSLLGNGDFGGLHQP